MPPSPPKKYAMENDNMLWLSIVLITEFQSEKKKNDLELRRKAQWESLQLRKH